VPDVLVIIVTTAEPPAVLGAPYVVQHPFWRRVIYAFIGFLMPIAVSTQNALLSSNLGSAAGEAGLTTAESEWLVVAYVAAAAFANLVVIKGRQQIGIMPILYGLLGANVLSGVLLIAYPAYGTLMLNRAINGLAVSTSVAAGVYYFIQSFPKSRRALAIALAIAAVQLSNAIAAQFPVEMLTTLGDRGFALLATAFCAGQLLITLAFPLPEAQVAPVAEPLDAVSAVLLCGACVTLVPALTLGRTMWWTDTPWIGWLLVTAVCFGAAGVAVELCRTRPLLHIGWLSTGMLVRFVLIAVLERIMLSEQTTGVIGLFGTDGLLNDQFHTLYLFGILGIVGGMVVLALTLSPKTIPMQCVVALAAIAVAATLDAGSNAQSRPENMYLSQVILGFGTALFVGSALLYGVGLVLKTDKGHFVSTIFVFSLSQSLGTVIGSALLGSVQYFYENYARVGLADRLQASASTHLVAARTGMSRIDASLSGQSTVLGYLNLFGLVRDMALCLCLILLLLTIIRFYKTPDRQTS